MVIGGTGNWSADIGHPVVRRYELALRDWPRGGDGLRVLFFSDLHPRPEDGRSGNLVRLRRVLEREAAGCDLIVYGGDLFNSRDLNSSPPEADLIAFFRGLRSPLGVYAVTGNHDSDGDMNRLRRIYRESGVRLLDNEVTAVPWRGIELQIAGVAYPHRGRLDWSKVLLARKPGRPTLLVSHHPELFDDAPRDFALTLSGHTHGGQLRLPLLGAAWLTGDFAQKYDWGLFERDGRFLAVTCGLGTSNLPRRWNAPPEVVVLTLRAR